MNNKGKYVMKQILICAAVLFVAFCQQALGVTPSLEGDNLVFTVGAGEETHTAVISGVNGVVKRGAGTLVLSAESTFTGKLTVEEGVLKAPIKTIRIGKPEIEVCDGATWDLSGDAGAAADSWANVFPCLTISGSGVDGQGALVKLSGNQNVYILSKELRLNGDATVAVADCGGKSFQFGREIHLNGHRLTKKGAGKWYFQGNSFKDNDAGESYGSLEVAEGELYVQHGTGFTGSEKNVLILAGGTMHLVECSATQSWAIKVTASSTLKTSASATGPFECKWNGPVNLAKGTLTLDVASRAPVTFGSTVTGANGCGISKKGLGIVKVKDNLNVLTTGSWDGILGLVEGGLEIVGGSAHKITGNIYANGKTGYLTFREAGNVRLQNVGGSMTFLAGTKETPQKLLISNTDVNSSGRTTTVGYNGAWGLVEVGEGSSFTGLLDLGYSAKNGGRGALWVKGGVVTVDGGDFKMSATASSVGYLRVDAGSVRTPKSMFVGQGGYALVDQRGGVVEVTSDYPLSIGGNGSSGLRNTGGYVSARYVDLSNASAFDNSQVLVTAEGRGVTNAFKNIRAFATGAVSSVLAMNDGGLLKVQRLIRADEIKDISENRSDFVLSFNGGGLAPTWDGDICQGYAAARRPNHVLVHEKGVVLDGGSLNNSGSPSDLPFSLTAPDGLVIEVIALPTDEAFLNDTTYLGAPEVKISGDGLGAAAVAEYDPVMRRVTGIVVVAPGTGFTVAPTVTIASSDGAKTYSCVATMTSAPTTGAGLVKRGKWPIRLNGVNTYNGPTTVEEGTLTFGVAGALPEGSGLAVRNGGTADLQGRQATVPFLNGDGVVTGSLKVTESLNLTAASNTTMIVNGTLTLGDGVVVSIPTGWEDRLSEDGNVLLRARDGLVLEGRVSFPDLDPRWRVRVVGKEIRAGRVRGFVLILK